MIRIAEQVLHNAQEVVEKSQGVRPHNLLKAAAADALRDEIRRERPGNVLGGACGVHGLKLQTLPQHE